MLDAWTRRKLLGVVGAVAAAGCLDTSDATESDEEPDDEGTNESDDGESTEGEEEPDGETDNESDGEEPTVHEDYETTEVRVLSPEGEERGSVTAAIADTYDLRRLGLSDTEELPEDRGMLFVFDSVDDRTFVMREMDFGIDIVYADADGVITAVHHAEQPESGESGEESEHEYPGRGQYVLEVNYEWTAERGVSEGDRLEFDLESESESSD